MSKEIPSLIKSLIVRGINHENLEPHTSVRHKFEAHRSRQRKWRHLEYEAKFDLPEDMWQFINWEMPDEWLENHYKIKAHEFFIVLPNMIPVIVSYKAVAFCEWLFYRYEIHYKGQVITSTKYYELALFLAIAAELGSPKKHKVKIEEISGQLDKNAKLKPFKSIMTEQEVYAYYNGWGGM